MTDTFPHGYALLIGVGECAYPRWSPLVTVKDKQALRAVLSDPALCGYPDDEAHIRLLEALQGAANRPGETVVRISHLMNHLGKAVPESARALGVERTSFFDAATEDFPVALLRGQGAAGRRLGDGAGGSGRPHRAPGAGDRRAQRGGGQRRAR